MKKIAPILLMAVALIVPVNYGATAAPLTPLVPAAAAIESSKYVTVGFSKRVFKRTWSQQSYSNQQTICRYYNWDRRGAVSRLSRATIQSGYWPARNIKRGINKVLRRAC